MSNSPDLFASAFRTAPRPLLLIAADSRYTMVAANEAHARAFASTPAALEGNGVLEVFGPNPDPVAREFRDAIRASLERVIATGAPDQMAVRPYAIQTEAGEEERYWGAVNSPIKDADGRVTHIISAVQDVTGEVNERRSEQARRLLMREVDHRARNALTMVQGLVRMTSTSELAEFRRVLEGRIEALARAQTSLAARKWEGASLRDVVETELKALTEPHRFALSGPAALLPAHHVQAASMVIHELATNALKYGALARPDGWLTVSWAAGPPIRLAWDESGVDGLEPPVRRGFGTRLVMQLGRQLGAEPAMEWRTYGLRVELTIEVSVADAEG